MRLGIKGKQVLYVTSIVGAFVVVLSLLYLMGLAQFSLKESRARAELLANAIFHRAREVVAETADPYAGLRNDPGLRAILASSLYGKNVTFAAIVDTQGSLVAKDPALEESALRSVDDLDVLMAKTPFAQVRVIYSSEGRNLELRQPLLLGGTEIGSIRIGVSTLLIRDDLNKSLRPAVTIAFIALVVAMLSALLSAQVVLRPIHMIRSGLTRLGRGELGVQLALDQDDELGELGTFFNTASEQLSADRSHMAGQMASLESAVEHLEDAVAMVNPAGELLFANPAAHALFPGAAMGTKLDDLVIAGHPVRRVLEDTMASRQSRGPVPITLGPASTGPDTAERLLLTHPVIDASGELVGIMVIVRNLEYLSQVQSTLRYSRKLVALGRLSAGVAHEVKNPLNSMMIHLELLRQYLSPRVPGRVPHIDRTARTVTAVSVAPSDAPPASPALEHLNVIEGEIRRLDEVVQGFLKFTRPEDLRLQPVRLSSLLQEIAPIVQPEADRNRVQLSIDCDGAPDVNGDPSMLRQAFLNLALNGCQAMPNGGTLRIRAEAGRGRQVAVSVSDTGTGIKPEHLSRIFDLYFTTKARGTGIGLSMVFRTVQMHDGEIEVQSTPGAGTTFTLRLPQA